MRKLVIVPCRGAGSVKGRTAMFAPYCGVLEETGRSCVAVASNLQESRSREVTKRVQTAMALQVRNDENLRWPDIYMIYKVTGLSYAKNSIHFMILSHMSRRHERRAAHKQVSKDITLFTPSQCPQFTASVHRPCTMRLLTDII